MYFQHYVKTRTFINLDCANNAGTYTYTLSLHMKKIFLPHKQILHIIRKKAQIHIITEGEKNFHPWFYIF